MTAYIRYTKNLGNSAIYIRLRNHTGQFWDFVGLLWITTEISDCRIFLNEKADSDPTESLYVNNLVIPIDEFYVQEAVLVSTGEVVGIDTTAHDSLLSDVLSISTATWSYAARTLTEVSGFTQLNVSNFSSQFKVNTDLYINVNMVTSNGTPVSGLIYPTTMSVSLYEAGILLSTSSSNITSSELEQGVYRIKIDKSLLDIPAIDYVLIVKDPAGNALADKLEFSLYEALGVDGAYQTTMTINDSVTSLPIPDVQVYVKNVDQSLIINKGITGVDGKYVVGLGEGIYKIILRKSFVDFTIPETITVTSSGTNTFTLEGSGFNASSPTQPETCVVFGTVIDLSGNYVKGAKVIASEPNGSRYNGTNKVVKLNKQTTTDINGYFELELIKSSQLTPQGTMYKIEITYPGLVYSKNVLIPDASTVEFSTL